MRIVSQCGQADFPYERTYILSDRENVKAVCDGKSYVIGRYSTHEKLLRLWRCVENSIWTVNTIEIHYLELLRALDG